MHGEIWINIMKTFIMISLLSIVSIGEEKGNIDLSKRPIVYNNDGTISTVLSASFNIDGKEVLLPMVSNKGTVLSPNEAIQEYIRTGKHLGVFNTPEEATKAAIKIHEQQEKMYIKK